MRMRILIETRHGADVIRSEYVEALAAFAIAQAGLPEATELSVTFVDNGEMRDLNAAYRGIDGPTDVLSFECDNLDDDFPRPPAGEAGAGEVYSLGDIVIAPDVALAQADQYGNTFEEELSLLLVHGVLHLAGYDHIDDADAEVMERAQSEILTAWRAQERGGAPDADAKGVS